MKLNDVVVWRLSFPMWLTIAILVGMCIGLAIGAAHAQSASTGKTHNLTIQTTAQDEARLQALASQHRPIFCRIKPPFKDTDALLAEVAKACLVVQPTTK